MLTTIPHHPIFTTLPPGETPVDMNVPANSGLILPMFIVLMVIGLGIVAWGAAIKYRKNKAKRNG